MTQPELFETKKRECTCCHRSATKFMRLHGEPNIMAFSMTVTRKGTGKSKHRAARAVRICEECFVKARSGDGIFGSPREATQLLKALMESLWSCYSALASEDGRAA